MCILGSLETPSYSVIMPARPRNSSTKVSEVVNEAHETRDPTTSESEDSSAEDKENQELEDQENSPDVSFPE